MRKRPLLLFLLCLALLGCSAPGQTETGTTRLPATTPTTLPAPAPTPDPTPTNMVSFTTKDHVTLKGLIYGHGNKALIFSHMYRDDKTDWQDFAQQMAARNYMTLVYDFRGHGDSGGLFDAANIPLDTEAAINFMVQQGADKIILLGASMGGMATVKAAARNDKHIAGIAVLSAPTSWKDLSASDAELQAIRVPKLFVNSNDDDYADDTRHMASVASQPKQLQMYSGNAHGVAIFETHHDELVTLLLNFILQNLRQNV